MFGELRRLVVADGALAGLELTDRLGVLEAVLPELTALHGVDQSDYHHLDVYDHTLEVLGQQIEVETRLDELFGADAARLRGALTEPLGDELTRGEAMRFAALVHDIGKPATRDVRRTAASPSWATTRVGEQMVHDLCRRLRTSERFARFVAALTRHHLVLGFLVHERPLDRAHGLPLPAPHRSRGGRGDAAVLRRPARHPRAQRRRGHRGPPRARAPS